MIHIFLRAKEVNSLLFNNYRNGKGFKMGNSPNVDKMIHQSSEVKKYFDTLKAGLMKDAKQFEETFDKYRQNFYTTNKWTDEELIFSAETTHFNQESEWSLDRLQKSVDNIADLIKANAAIPDGFNLNQEGIRKIGKAYNGLMASKALAATVIFEVISAAMEGVGGNTTASLTNEMQQGIIGKGFSTFTLVASRSYTDTHYFGSISIVGYSIRTELWFSQEQAAAEANISWVETEMNKAAALEKALGDLDLKFSQGDLTYDEWQQQRTPMENALKKIKGEIEGQMAADLAFVY